MLLLCSYDSLLPKQIWPMPQHMECAFIVRQGLFQVLEVLTRATAIGAAWEGQGDAG